MGLFDFVANLFVAKDKRSINYSNGTSFGMVGGGTGIPVDENTALTNTAVWAAVRILSESVAQLPLQL